VLLFIFVCICAVALLWNRGEVAPTMLHKIEQPDVFNTHSVVEAVAAEDHAKVLQRHRKPLRPVDRAVAPPAAEKQAAHKEEAVTVVQAEPFDKLLDVLRSKLSEVSFLFSVDLTLLLSWLSGFSLAAPLAPCVFSSHPYLSSDPQLRRTVLRAPGYQGRRPGGRHSPPSNRGYRGTI